MNGWRFALATLAISPFAPVWNGLVYVLRLAETELQLLMRPANLKQSADHGAFFGLLDDLSQFLLYPIPGGVGIGLVRLRPVGISAVSAACGGKNAGDINPAQPHLAY
ncbi:hypothetical protein [Methylomonas sp. DH-1]|uniref:hypothetical protein n=1 Tax=Methylomonas sp. (strain DH-1) TaxID=1727196 RepID=UPI0007C96816|nr:hypothetical protein [Methylomonas sp. DH-1]ANE54141.1 hypothetical protein AYM39_02345 [Methylomonas sp. DH-1]